MSVGFLYLAFGFVFFHAVTAEQPSATKKDPCYNVFCTKGRMCVVNSDRSTTCVCPEVCPDDYSPVCSAYLREFNNTCKLHKFACRVGIMMEIERRGKCDLEDVEREPCPVPNLLQFHDRYLTYLIAAREREMYQDFRVESWTYEDRRAVIEWEFTNQDKNGNGILDKEEIEAMMIPDEDCMIGFLKSCDYDHQPGISKAEWITCFPPMVPELSEEDVQS